jgi:hypothetical protein
MYPVLYLGVDDIYNDDAKIPYRFGWMLFLMAATLGALHIFGVFDARKLITSDFWTSVLNIWYYFGLYLLVGIVYSFIRWFFYLQKYKSNLELTFGENATKDNPAVQAAYKKRPSAKGSRLRFIVKCVYAWPWSLTSWLLHDAFFDCIRWLWKTTVKICRNLFGGIYGWMARLAEPKVFREMEADEKAARDAGKKQASTS